MSIFTRLDNYLRRLLGLSTDEEMRLAFEEFRCQKIERWRLIEEEARAAAYAALRSEPDIDQLVKLNEYQMRTRIRPPQDQLEKLGFYQIDPPDAESGEE